MVKVYKKPVPFDKLDYILGYNNCILQIKVKRKIPLFALIKSDIIAGEESNGYESFQVWFFKWFRIKYDMVWVS